MDCQTYNACTFECKKKCIHVCNWEAIIWDKDGHGGTLGFSK